MEFLPYRSDFWPKDFEDYKLQPLMENRAMSTLTFANAGHLFDIVERNIKQKVGASKIWSNNLFYPITLYYEISMKWSNNYDCDAINDVIWIRLMRRSKSHFSYLLYQLYVILQGHIHRLQLSLLQIYLFHRYFSILAGWVSCSPWKLRSMTACSSSPRSISNSTRHPPSRPHWSPPWPWTSPPSSMA